ncbi:MAG TPA: hypothetical protein VK851_05785 [Anaerolineales bacterium]|nr:hypothetical protein [Anaerolineales bacterium]
MTDQRIILANDSRLIREMLNRILLKAEHLEVVQQVDDQGSLPDSIQQQDAEWIILSLSEDNKIPDWADDYIREHPLLRILTVSHDGSWVKMKRLDKREQDFVNLSLQELLNILEGSLHTEAVDSLQEVT